MHTHYWGKKLLDAVCSMHHMLYLIFNMQRNENQQLLLIWTYCFHNYITYNYTTATFSISTQKLWFSNIYTVSVSYNHIICDRVITCILIHAITFKTLQAIVTAVITIQKNLTDKGKGISRRFNISILFSFTTCFGTWIRSRSGKFIPKTDFKNFHINY
jgi:hypothetical protein